MFEKQARRSAVGVGDDLRADWYLGLDDNLFAQGQTALPVTVGDCGNNSFIPAHFAVEQFSDDIAGKIVAGRTEATGNQNDVAALERFGDSGAHFGAVVGNGGLADEAQTDFGQLTSEVIGVGVDDESKQEFAAGIDEFDAHRLVGCFVRRAFAVRQNFFRQVHRPVIIIADGAADFVLKNIF